MAALNRKRHTLTGAAGILCALLLTLCTWAAAAPITAAPTPVTQPDGTALMLYSSGDEFFNYIHDQAGNLVMRRSDGWYVYAQNENGVPTPTGAVVGGTASGQATLFGGVTMTAADIDFSAHPELITTLDVTEPDGEEVYLASAGQAGQDEPAQLMALSGEPREQMANLVIFIRFKGEEEFITLDEDGLPIAPIPEESQIEGLPSTIHFGDSYRQVSSYMQTVSNGNFDIRSTFLTADETGATILSYEDIYPRSYYESIDGSSDQRFYAEMELLERAIAHVAHSIPAGAELDYNNDGNVDNITFIVSGATAGWNDLLWPHSWALQLDKIYLQSRSGWKQCFQFNFNFANPRYAGVGVLSHELLHAVGYPDLYRYDYSGDPVGRWDAMGSTDYADPQFIGAYLKDAYTTWGNLGHISASGTYTLWPLGTQTNPNDPSDPVWEGYQIPTGTVGEYICVEYRKNGPAGDVTADNVPCDGLLVYRANRKTTQGNRNGTLSGGDEVYVFRPGDANPNAGTKAGLATAALDGVSRTAMGAGLEADCPPETTLYLDNGKNSGIIVDQVEVLSDGRISFRVTLTDDPTPITPGRYDVDGDDYFISQSGAYAFYGSTTRHHITVAAGVKNVNITFEAANMDLSAQTRNLSPLTLRAGAEVTVSLAPGGDGEGVTLLSGSVYMPGIKVEKGAKATIQSAGGELNAAGGVGAPGVGSDAFSDGGTVHIKNLHATLSGGGGYELTSGSTIFVLSKGSSALGGGFHQTMDGITIENSTLEALGANSVQAISTGYLDISGGEYVPGGDLTIRNSVITAQGSVDGGKRLTVEDSTLSVIVSSASLYNSALNATELIALTDSATTLTAQGSNTGMNRNTRDTCAVEVRGGSLYVASYITGIAGNRVAVSADADLVIATAGETPLAGPWSDEGTTTTGGIVAPAGEQPGVFLQGTFAAVTPYRATYSLTNADSTAGRYVDLPSGTRAFLVSLPQADTYTLRDEDAAASAPLPAPLTAVNSATAITLQAPSRLERRVDVSSGNAHLTQNGTYVLSGNGTGRVTVASGLKVTIYLDNITIDAADGPALTIGSNTTADLIAKSGTENYLTGGAGYPAVKGEGGSALAFRGTGLVAAMGGAGSAGVEGQGSVTVEQVTALVALSDQPSALIRAQADGASWSSLTGAAPTVTRITLAQPLPSDDLLTIFTPEGGRQLPAQAGVKSLLLTLRAPGEVTLERSDGAVTDPLDCRQTVAVHSAVTFKQPTLEQGGVLDLSLKSYTVTKSGQYVVTGATTTNTLRVAPGISVHLRFENVSVTQFAEATTIVDLGAGSVTTIELPAGTKNRLEAVTKAQAPEANAIHVPATARLTITGEGGLTVSGGVNVTTIGAGKNEEGGVISIAGGDITFTAPAGSGNSRWGLGGSGSRVDISGGTLRQAASYGMGIGGSNSRVTIRGGELNWRPAERMPIGGEQSTVTITGGDLTLDLLRALVGIGGAGSRVTVQGGEIALLEPDNGSGVSAAMGGKDSRLTLTGGVITGTLKKPPYSGYGGFGGENATATVGGDVSVFIRYRHKDANPTANAGLFSGIQAQAAFLDVRFLTSLTTAETLTLTRESDSKTVTLPMKQGDAGFFLLLEEGVWHLENATGGYGGAYSLTPGVTTQRNVTFNRLRGVFLESQTVEYSGATHTLTVRGLPSGASVRYTNNVQREPGVYAVTATVTTPAGETYDLNATLTITKARLTVTGIRVDDKVYNGNTAATGRILFAGAKGSDAPGLSATFRFQNANAGANKTVTAANVQFSTSQWASRYDLDDIDAALLTTRATITPKPVALTFPQSSLRQMAGIVTPVVPTFRESGLAAGDISVTYAIGNGAPTATVPQTPGEYTVTATITNPNYCSDGSASATLLVETGFDLQTGDAIITAPGEYTITSQGQPTNHRIIVDSSVSGEVTIYLSGVSIQADSGKDAVELRHGARTNIYARENTVNHLVGGANAAAVSANAATYFAGEGDLFLYAGAGGTATRCATGSNHFSTSKKPERLWLVTNESDPAQNFLTFSYKWVAMTFAEIPSEDTAFSLTVAGKTTPFTLPAGYQKVWRGADSYTLETRRTTLQDRNGDRLRSGTASSSGLIWTGIPLIAPPRQIHDLNLATAPHTITESGIYRVYGTKNVTSTSGNDPVITIADGLEVELILDNILVGYSDQNNPVISLGKGADLTLTARGNSRMVSALTAIVWENCGDSSPTGSVKLQGEPGGSVTLTASCVQTDTDASNAVIFADTVTVESGNWILEQKKEWRFATVWCVRSPGGFTMTGGQVKLDCEAGLNRQSGRYYAGGIFAKGDVTLTGGELSINCYAMEGGNTGGTNAYSDRYVAGIYLGNTPDSHVTTLTIDGAQVSVYDPSGLKNGTLIRVAYGNVELRSGSLNMVRDGDGYGIYCKNLTAVGGFTLTGLDGSPMSDPKDAVADTNYLLVQPSDGTVTCLPGPDGNVPVVYVGQFNNGNGIKSDNKKDIEVVFTDSDGVERTVILPKWNGINAYLNFLVLLPHAGQYSASYTSGTKTYTTTIGVTGDGEVTGDTGEFGTAATFTGVELLDGTFLWDGTPKTLAVVYDILPPGATVKYTYNTADGEPPVEPGKCTVTARLTAPGYTPKELTANLTVQKRPLTLTATVLDKAVYDGATDAQGVLTISGALLEEDTFTATATFAFADANVGADKRVNITNVVVTGPENWQAHYALTIPDPLTATASILEKAPLTVVWNQPSLTQTYGSVSPVGAVLRAEKGEDEKDENAEISALKLTLLYDGEANLPTLPGLYTVTAVLDDPNYSAQATAQFRIQPRALTITALTVPNGKVGGETEKTVEKTTGFTLAEPGLVAGDKVGVRFTVRYDDLTEGSGKPVTITDLTLTGSAADRYYVADYPTAATATIDPAGTPGPEKPDPEKPDPEKPDPEKPDPEKPDPVKPTPTPSGNGDNSSGPVVTPPTDPEPPVQEDDLPIRHSGKHPFIDLPGHWGEDNAEWCWQRELMNGVSADRFDPDGPMTRAMFVTILGRMEGLDTARWAGKTASFTDVEAGSWYAPYVAWAHAAGLVLGRDATTFAPAEPITRQELAVLLRRYLVWRGMPLGGGNTSSYADASSIASWAEQSVADVTATGLLVGFPNGTFGPRKPLTRAQAATLLRRMTALRYPTLIP